MKSEVENGITYEELDRIVQEYKDGKPGSAEALLESYKGFLAIYKNLLCGGIIYPGHTRMRHFIGLFIMRYNIRKSLDRYNYMPNIKQAIYSTAKMISNLCRHLTKAEIENELSMILLDMAKRYHKKKYPTFHLYVEKAFNYRLKKRIEELSNDPLVRSDWLTYIDEQYENESTSNLIETDTVLESIQESIDKKNADTLTVVGSGLNLNWINGVTATGIFKMLSSLERRILIMYYIEKKSDEEIARELGYTARETINRKRNKAKSIIETYIKNNKLYRFQEDTQFDNIDDIQEEAEETKEIKVYYARLF